MVRINFAEGRGERTQVQIPVRDRKRPLCQPSGTTGQNLQSDQVLLDQNQKLFVSDQNTKMIGDLLILLMWMRIESAPQLQQRSDLLQMRMRFEGRRKVQLGVDWLDRLEEIRLPQHRFVYFGKRYILPSLILPQFFIAWTLLQLRLLPLSHCKLHTRHERPSKIRITGSLSLHLSIHDTVK